MDVSVIIPVRNGASTIGEQLAGLADQTFDGDWEVVVVDNGSTDATVVEAELWSERLPVRVVHAIDSPSESNARNVGVRAAAADRLLFCDADDVVQPGWIAAHARALEQHELIAGSLDLRMFGRDSSGRDRGPTARAAGAKDWKPFAPGCNFALTRRAFDAADGFDESLVTAQDKDFSWRLQLDGIELHFEPEAVVVYRPRATQRGAWKQHYRYAMGEVALYRKLRLRGMPARDRRTILSHWWFALTGWRRASPAWRRRWTITTAGQVGRLVGSIRYRTFYL